MIKLPRLYSSSGTFIRPLNVISASLTLNMTPLSTASLQLRKGENVPLRAYVEMFNPYGSVGMFRACSPNDCYGTETTSVELEHMITEVGDYLVKEDISEMVAASTAMSRVFKGYNGSFWKLGSVSALGSGKIALECNHERVLDAMLAILEQVPSCMMKFDFTTSPKWTVSFVKKPTDVTAECRLSRNVTSAQINYDDSELCTRAYYGIQSKDKNGKTVTTWKYKDASTKSTYGIVERTVSISSDMTDTEIDTVVNAYLEDHKKPRVSVSIEASELAAITKESMDKFEVGKMLRLVIPERNVVVEEYINTLTWSDLYNAPDRVSVSVGDERDTVVTFLHNLDSKGAGGGGGGRSRKKQDDEWSQFQSDFQVLDDQIFGYVQKVDKTGKILEKAGLDINSQGVLIYSQKPGTIGAKFNVMSDKISLVVSGEGENAKIKPAAIVAAINNGSSSVKISADHIILDGEAVADSLDGEEIMCGSLDCQRGSISVFTCDNSFRFEGSSFVLDDPTSFSFKGHTVSWKSFTYRSIVLSPARSFLYANSPGSTTPITTQTGHIVSSYEDNTIHYLGY